MKKLTEDLYLIEEGLYAERRGAQWVISNEASHVVAGPFSSLEALDDRRGRDDSDPDTLTLEEELAQLDSTDLVTLREAAEHLPVSHQALFAARRRGTLKVEPLVTARSTTLYSLKALKEAYER